MTASGVPLTEEEAADEAKRYIDEAVATVAEMQVTEEQLKVGYCAHSVPAVAPPHWHAAARRRSNKMDTLAASIYDIAAVCQYQCIFHTERFTRIWASLAIPRVGFAGCAVFTPEAEHRRL